MPDGRTHHSIWNRFIPVSIVVGVGVSLLCWVWGLPVYSGLGVIVGYFLGRYISPDLDLIGINNDESRMMSELKIVGVLLVMWFFPYAYLMRFVGIGKKGHRNFFSHFPLISTTIRIVWLAVIPAVLIYFYKIEYLTPLLYTLLVLTVGLSIADLFHYIADMYGNMRPIKKLLGIKRRR